MGDRRVAVRHAALRWALPVVALALGACETPPPSYREGWSLAGGAHVGYATIDVDGGANPEGVVGGARLAVFKSLSPIEIGARVSLGETYGSSSENGFDLDVDVLELQVDGVVRWLLHDSRGEVTPWVELFGGGGYYDADVDVNGSGFFSLGGSDDAVGVTLGGGAGTEFVLDRYSSLSVGAEVRYSTYDTDVLGDAGEVDVMGTFMVVHRW